MRIALQNYEVFLKQSLSFSSFYRFLSISLFPVAISTLEQLIQTQRPCPNSIDERLSSDNREHNQWEWAA